MTLRLLRQELDIDANADPNACVFIGDSPNDAPMFGFFPHAVGVSNILAFGARVDPLPAYICRQRCGAGFNEIVNAVLAALG